MAKLDSFGQSIQALCRTMLAEPLEIGLRDVTLLDTSSPRISTETRKTRFPLWRLFVLGRHRPSGGLIVSLDDPGELPPIHPYGKYDFCLLERNPTEEEREKSGQEDTQVRVLELLRTIQSSESEIILRPTGFTDWYGRTI